MQLKSANKRQRQSESKIEVLTEATKKVVDADAAVVTAKRLDTAAQTRVAKPIVAGGAKFTKAYKHTALNSDRGGEMAGLDTTLK